MAREDLPDVRCPECGTPIPAGPEWRLVTCPGCGRVVSRMETDPNYD